MCDVNGTACDAIVFSDDMSTTVDQVSLFNNLYIMIISIWNPLFHARIQRGWGGGGDSLENHKAIAHLSHTGQSHSYKASIQCWAIIGPPVKRHLKGDDARLVVFIYIIKKNLDPPMFSKAIHVFRIMMSNSNVF